MRDIELKRLRGELSCAECRRLKLRCDKKVPCGSCCRRGCESICPCGILSAGQGTRFILADTEQLHRKIADMSNRIRQLEDALAILQSATSDKRHPLLSDELLKVKFGSEALNPPQDSSSDRDASMLESIDVLGTLTLGDSGEVKYFGRSAGSETLMMTGEETAHPLEDAEDGEAPIALSPELENLANLFPFTSQDRPDSHSLEMLESLLPTPQRAWNLCESYFLHGALFFRPIRRNELMDILLPKIYETAYSQSRSRAAAESSPPSDHTENPKLFESTRPHALAALYFTFSLGALLDLGMSPYNAEAEHYYDLGRAALSLHAAYESPTMETVQAMGLMATYRSLAGSKYSRDSAWCVMSFAAKLAQSIGLHRDSAPWNIDPATVQKRRNLFWEVFAADVSHSLALGRPPAIHLSYVDCEYPIDDEENVNEAGEIQTGFWRMKHTFGRDIFNSVADATLTAKSPRYSAVLDLDKKVRELSFPVAFKPYASLDDGEETYYSSSLSLRDFYASQHRTVTMLYLHRSFFAQALLDHPKNPLLSPFAPSFLTSYRSASIVIKASAHQFDRCAAMAMRVWFLLSHMFSAAVIVGTVVTRSPNLNFASAALHDLDLAVELFRRTAVQSRRARIALGVLQKLREKALRAYSLNSSIISSSPSFGSLPPQIIDDGEDELAIFGGQTRVLNRTSRHKPSSPTHPSSSPRSESSASSPPTFHEEVHGQALTTISDTRPNNRNLAATSAHLDLPIQVDMPPTIVGVNAYGYVSSSHSIKQPVASCSAQQYNRLIDLLPSQVPGSLPQQPSSSAMQRYDQPEKTRNWSLWDRHGQLPQSPSDANSWPSQYSSPQRQSLSFSEGVNLSPLSTYTSAMPPVAYSGYGDGLYAAQLMNPAGAVEIGLSSESGMDARWMTLMHDCGIMEADTS